MKKNGFLTFVCGCVPGCGQMYYGYMRRGISLALWFWGVVFLASLSGLGVLGILLPVIWAYAFFDTFNIRALTYEQRLAFVDTFLPGGEWLRNGKNSLFAKGSGGRLLGWLLIVVGALALYNTLLGRYLWRLYETLPALARVLDSLPAIVIAVVVILLGVRMLRGPRASAPEEQQAPPSITEG